MKRNYDNTFNTEPEFECHCGLSERGCKTCIKERCFSWDKCKGKAGIEK